MGFFKRFFSLGSKKSRRRQQARHEELVDANGRIVQAAEPWNQADRDATRLLRSSSAHFSVVSEVDYSSLPPLPHPINSVAHTPATTPTKSVASVQRRGTYTVKVLERKLESRTEFPNANPPITHQDEPDVLEDSPLAKRADPRRVPFTPRDQSRLLRLRQDPSVASLLNMYDDKGRISSTAFSNTPPAATPIEDFIGRQPVKRSGSTLRQLLGEPVSDDQEAAEGDISWAERYLGEHAGSSHSLASSAPVETPKDLNAHFSNDPSIKPFMPNFTFSPDLSQDVSANYPFISSMEVELSGATEHDISSPIVEEHEPEETRTPMRASEVFGFLTERRKSILERQRSQRQRSFTAPAVPAKDEAPPLPSSSTTTKATPSPDTSDISPTTSPAQIYTATVTKLTPILNPLSRSTDTLNVLYNMQTSPLSDCSTSPSIHQVPTRIQFTGESQSTVASTASTSQSKIPRGPRPLPSTNMSTTPRMDKTRASQTNKPAICNATMELPTPAPTPAPRTRIPKHSHDPHTPVRHRHPKRRINSQTSSVASNNDDDENSMRIPAAHRRQQRKASRELKNKENSPPSVPLRTIFDMRYPNFIHGGPPSPASSSELSPVAKEMMMSLRKQRMRARDEMRSGGKHHSRKVSSGR